MMQQGMNTLEIDRMAPQAQGIETLGSMEEVPMVPEGGIQAAVPDATRMLADAGRHGDIYVVHASEGETVVPKEVLEGPGGQQIRESLFRQMEQMGVDPGRYVVGNELNSVNPETGLPEFFFKKAFKSIKKFFKKAAPIILPIVLTPFIGPIAAGAVGSGIGTLIQGGSAKDALKAAAFGGITAGVMSGISGMAGMSGPNVEGFWGGVQSGLPSGLTSGGPSGVIPFTGGPDQAAKQSVWFSSTPGDGQVSPGIFKPNWDHSIFGSGPSPSVQATGAPPTPRLANSNGMRVLSHTVEGSPANTGAAQLPPPPKNVEGFQLTSRTTNAPSDQGFLNKNVFKGVGDYFPEWMGGTPDAAAQSRLVDARLAAYNNALAKMEAAGRVPDKELAQKIAMQVSGGSNLKQYSGPGVLAGIGAYAGGFFDEPEQEELKSKFDPIPQSKIDPLRIDIRPPPPPEAPIQFSTFAAHGGEMQRDFPRRNGAISGPGTGTSDDVPAMLSDGEFVLTEKAVRGAGNGSRRQGVQNLYNLMRNFEATV
jgi:hypothetical protein